MLNHIQEMAQVLRRLLSGLQQNHNPAFVREVGKLGALKKTKNKILKPVPFSPMQ